MEETERTEKPELYSLGVCGVPTVAKGSYKGIVSMDYYFKKVAKEKIANDSGNPFTFLFNLAFPNKDRVENIATQVREEFNQIKEDVGFNIGHNSSYGGDAISFVAIGLRDFSEKRDNIWKRVNELFSKYKSGMEFRLKYINAVDVQDPAEQVCAQTN